MSIAHPPGPLPHPEFGGLRAPLPELLPRIQAKPVRKPRARRAA